MTQLIAKLCIYWAIAGLTMGYLASKFLRGGRGTDWNNKPARQGE